MSAARPSRLALVMTWLAVGASLALLALGTYWYGLSVEVQQRFWSNLTERLHGPMTFRFVLQPIMAGVAALADGLDDARHGHRGFTGRLGEGLVSTARVVLLGLSMDVIYQFKALDQFYPGEAVMMALLLALIPYFVFRWIVERIAARVIHRSPA